MVIDEDLIALWDIDDCVNCKSFGTGIPREMCIRYAGMVESGRYHEDSALLLPVPGSAHLKIVRYKARSIRRRVRRATKCLKFQVARFAIGEGNRPSNGEEFSFRKDGSTTWNISGGLKPQASAWRLELAEMDHLGIIGRESESMQCRLQLLTVLE